MLYARRAEGEREQRSGHERQENLARDRKMAEVCRSRIFWKVTHSERTKPVSHQSSTHLCIFSPHHNFSHFLQMAKQTLIASGRRIGAFFLLSHQR